MSTELIRTTRTPIQCLQPSSCLRVFPGAIETPTDSSPIGTVAPWVSVRTMIPFRGLPNLVVKIIHPPYPPRLPVSRDENTTTSHRPLYSQDARFLKEMRKEQAKYPPTFSARIEGRHTESTRKKDTGEKISIDRLVPACASQTTKEITIPIDYEDTKQHA